MTVRRCGHGISIVFVLFVGIFTPLLIFFRPSPRDTGRHNTACHYNLSVIADKRIVSSALELPVDFSLFAPGRLFRCCPGRYTGLRRSGKS